MAADGVFVRRHASIANQGLRTLAAQNLEHGATTGQRGTYSGTAAQWNGSDGSCSETVTRHSAFRRYPPRDTSSLPGGVFEGAINLSLREIKASAQRVCISAERAASFQRVGGFNFAKGPRV
jgi:hypothetical protein